MACSILPRVDGGAWHHGVANLGVRPTFGGEGRLSLEVHLLEFRGDIYGSEVEVAFARRLRGERRFPSSDALVRQIRQDVADARSVLSEQPEG